MQFEQLDVFNQRFDVPQSVTYRQLDNDGKVYSKIDWLTVMFFDSSLNDVLTWLHLEDCVSDFCASVFQQSRGYDEVFKFTFNGVMLETSCFNYYGEDMNVSIFDTVVPKIRLDLSGSALDYLRSIGVDMDSYRFVEPVLPDGGSYHFTRCDWAFDFVNYKPEFVDRMLHHIDTNMLPSGRVPLASTKGAISCKVVKCNQKTIYLGSPQSDRMLRVYDKRMQYVNAASQTYVKPNPYNNPDSWFRIEWQTRNKFANNLVHDSSLEFKHILKLIFEKYAFADGAMDARRCARVPVDFWLELFDWSDLETRIIQNANYVEYESRPQKIINSWRSIMIRTYLFVDFLDRMCVGIDIENECNDYLRSLEGRDPTSRRRSVAFYSILNEILNEYNLTIPTCSEYGGLWNNMGRLYFKR